MKFIDQETAAITVSSPKEVPAAVHGEVEVLDREVYGVVFTGSMEDETLVLDQEATAKLRDGVAGTSRQGHRKRTQPA